MHASNPRRATRQPSSRYRARELRGVVERITYQNPENGYTVARSRRSAPRPLREVTSASVPSSARSRISKPGEAIVATGFWVNDPSMAGNSKPLRHGPPSLPLRAQALSRLGTRRASVR